jgi:hypothetical protein
VEKGAFDLPASTGSPLYEAKEVIHIDIPQSDGALVVRGRARAGTPWEWRDCVCSSRCAGGSWGLHSIGWDGGTWGLQGLWDLGTWGLQSVGWDRGFRYHFEPVRSKRHGLMELGVGKIGHSFRDGRKYLWRFRPTHRKSQRKANEVFLTIFSRE